MENLHQTELVFLSLVNLGGFENFLLHLTPGRDMKGNIWMALNI